MQVHLNEQAINKALKDTVASKKRRELADKALPGLRLRVTPSGRGTWVLGCRDATGVSKRFALGSWPAMGISNAREAARRERERVRSGVDPIKARRAAAEAARLAKERERLTVGVLVEDWRREWLAPHRSERYAAEAVRALQAEILFFF